MIEQVGIQIPEAATIDDAIATNLQLIERLQQSTGPMWLKLKRDGGLEYDLEACGSENRTMLDEVYSYFDINVLDAETTHSMNFVPDVDRQRVMRTVSKTAHISEAHGFTFVEHETIQGNKKSFGVIVSLTRPGPNRF